MEFYLSVMILGLLLLYKAALVCLVTVILSVCIFSNI